MKYSHLPLLLSFFLCACSESHDQIQQEEAESEALEISVSTFAKTVGSATEVELTTNELLLDPDTLTLHLAGFEQGQHWTASINNQFSFDLSTQLTPCPTPLGIGAYTVLLAELDSNGYSTSGQPQIVCVAHEEATEVIDSSTYAGWFVGITETSEGQVMVDYQIASLKPSTTPTARLYLDDKFLTESNDIQNIQIDNVPVGTHKLRLEVCDAEGNLLTGQFTKTEKRFETH